MNRLFISTLFSFLFVTLAFAAAPETFHMDPKGNDSWPGTEMQPFATIARFCATAQPGQTLIVHGGRYSGQTAVLTRSGTKDRPISIVAAPDEVPIFDGSGYSRKDVGEALLSTDPTAWGPNAVRHIRIEGLVITNYFRGGISLGWNTENNELSIEDIQISNTLVDMCGQNGLMVAFGDGCVLRENLVSRTGWLPEADSWSSNLNLYNMTGVDNHVIGNVSFHGVDISKAHTDGNGMILDMFNGPSGAGATVEYNLIFANGGSGITWTRTSNALIRANTVVENGIDPSYRHGPSGLNFWRGETEGDFENITIEGNLVTQTKGRPLLVVEYAKLGSGSRHSNLYIADRAPENVGFRAPLRADFCWTPSTQVPDFPRYRAESGLWIDPLLIKVSSAQQPISWYRFAPDIDYVVAKKGLRHCLKLVPRPAGAPKIGAVVSLSSEE